MSVAMTLAPERGEPLHRQLAQAAQPDHQGGLAAAGEHRHGLLDGVVRGQASIGERGCCDRVGVAQGHQVARRHGEVLSHAAVASQSGA